jgi:hypothetical protein
MMRLQSWRTGLDSNSGKKGTIEDVVVLTHTPSRLLCDYWPAVDSPAACEESTIRVREMEQIIGTEHTGPCICLGRNGRHIGRRLA